MRGPSLAHCTACCVADREAVYVLDEILGNATDLPITEHATDTAGQTLTVFSLFALTGFTLSPRIRVDARGVARSGSGSVAVISNESTEEVRPITASSGRVLSPHGRAVHTT